MQRGARTDCARARLAVQGQCSHSLRWLTVETFPFESDCVGGRFATQAGRAYVADQTPMQPHLRLDGSDSELPLAGDWRRRWPAEPERGVRASA